MTQKFFISLLILSTALLFQSCKSTGNEKVNTDPAALVLSTPDIDNSDTGINDSEETGQTTPAPDSIPAVEKVPLPSHEEPAVKQQPVTTDEIVTTRHLDADNYYNIGVSLYNTGHYEDAAGAFKKALLINPAYIRAHSDLTLSYIKLDNLIAALDEYKKLLNLSQDMSDSLRKAAVDEVSSSGDYKFIIQVGAFRKLKNAEELISNLKPEYLFVYSEKPGNLHKVRIHGIKTMNEGKRIMQDIKKQLNIIPFMIIRE